MSHTTRVAVEGMSDPECFEGALGELGLTVEHEAMCRLYGGRQEKCDIVVKFGRYDLGFNIRSDGTIESVGDHWGLNQMEDLRAMGGYNGFMKKLKAQYTAKVVHKQMARNRNIVGRSQTVKGGKLQLRFRVR